MTTPFTTDLMGEGRETPHGTILTAYPMNGRDPWAPAMIVLRKHGEQYLVSLWNAQTGGFGGFELFDDEADARAFMDKRIDRFDPIGMRYAASAHSALLARGIDIVPARSV